MTSISISNICRLENIDAIEIVKKLNSNTSQLYEHFYSGDRDTYIEAFDSICVKYNLGDFSSLSKIDREKYCEMYKSEIDIEFDKFVSHGKEMISFHKKVSEYLNDLILQEKNNFSVSEKREFYLRQILKPEEEG